MVNLNDNEKKLFCNEYLKNIATENLNIIENIINSNIPDIVISDIVYSLIRQILSYDSNDFNYILNIHLMIWFDFLNNHN